MFTGLVYDDSSIELLSTERIEVRQLPQTPPTVVPADDEEAEPSPPPKRVKRSNPSTGSQRRK